MEGIVRIFASVLENNSATRRVLEKNAFVFEGVACKSAWKNEELLDEWKYSILKEDYHTRAIKHN
ncbi:MAG: GNAT family N-acetyltransferase [Saprospiraceae bacterium]